METKKVFLTAHNTILIVTAKTNGYVSITAHEIEPITVQQAKERTRESLEDGELWRMAVEAKQTELGLSEWVDFVIDTDGSTCLIDNSLYSDELDLSEYTHNSDDVYLFDSLSCGCLHDDIKKVTPIFNRLIELHLKSTKKGLKEAEKLIAAISPDDVEAKVKKLTIEALQLEKIAA